MDFIGTLIGSLIGAIIAGVVIWLIAKLRMGLEVKNFAWAMIAGVLIGTLSHLALQLMTDFGGLGGLLVRLVVSAGVIFGCGSFLKGLTVKGYGGALLAAVAIALINFGVTFLLGSTAAQ